MIMIVGIDGRPGDLIADEEHEGLEQVGKPAPRRRRPTASCSASRVKDQSRIAATTSSRIMYFEIPNPLLA